MKKVREKVKKYSEKLKSALNDGSRGRCLNKRGLAYEELGRIEDALRDYSKAIECGEYSYVGYLYRGDLYSKLGKKEEAIRNYTKSIEIKKDYLVAYNNRGLAYSDLGKNEEAIRDFTTTIGMDKKFYQAYNNRGLCFNQMKEFGKAKSDLNQAILLSPQNSYPFKNRGVTFRWLKNFSQARKDFGKAIELDSKNSKAYFERGKLCIIEGKYLGAKSDFDQALSVLNERKSLSANDKELTQKITSCLKKISPQLTEIAEKTELKKAATKKRIFWESFEKTASEVKKCLEFYSLLDRNFARDLETANLNLWKILFRPIEQSISASNSGNALSLHHVCLNTSLLLKKAGGVFSDLVPAITAVNENIFESSMFFKDLNFVVEKLRKFFKGLELTEEGFTEEDFEEMYSRFLKCSTNPRINQLSVQSFLKYYQVFVFVIMKSKATFLEFNSMKPRILSLQPVDEKRNLLRNTIDKREFQKYVSLAMEQNKFVSKLRSLLPKMHVLERTFDLPILRNCFKVSGIEKEMKELVKATAVMNEIEATLGKLKVTVARYFEKTRLENLKMISLLIKAKNEVDSFCFPFYSHKINVLLQGTDLACLQKAMSITANIGMSQILKKIVKQKIVLEKVNSKFGFIEVCVCWENDGLVYFIEEKKETTSKTESKAKEFHRSSLLEIPKDRFEYVEVNEKKVILGIGGFGEVRKIKILSIPERMCAMKVIKFDGSLKVMEETIRKEVFMVKYLSHPGIVSVFGYVRFSDYKIGIVMEFMDGGNLFHVVNKTKGKISNFEKYYLSKRMIGVVLFLHEEKGIIHRDIKPQNWLCSADRKIIKLSDFGLMTIKASSSTKGGGEVKGTFRYIANELYDEDTTYSFTSDIFALGMTLYYLFVEKEPFYEIKNSPMAAMQIMLKLSEGGSPTFPESGVPKEFVKIVKMCVADVKKRPSARELLEYVCSVEKKFVKVNPPKQVVVIKERKCQFCFTKSYCYLSQCCSKFFCEECIMKRIEKKNCVQVKCFERCKAKFSREWIHRTKNAKLTEKLFILDLKKKYNKCGNCGNLIDIVQTNENKMQCQRCKKDICRFCFRKWTGKRGLCSNEECELFEDPLESLNVKPEMIPFKFTGEKEARSIFRARLCPWCGNPIFRMINSTACKHMDCPCGNSFCFVCLGRKKGKMNDESKESWHEIDGGDPWGYCGLAVKQTEVPKKNFEQPDNEDSDALSESDDETGGH